MQRRSVRVIATSCLFAIGVLGCDRSPSASLATPWQPLDHERLPGEDEAPAALGKAPALDELAWAQRCVGCHGADGKGTGVASVPDFTRADWQRTRSDAALRASIVEGRGAMPKFDLPEGAVTALVARVRAFAR